MSDKIKKVTAGLYNIPLPIVLEDSTHGVMTKFEIITVRVEDSNGAEGVGYTFTCGRNGGAVHNIVEREIAEITEGEDPEKIEALWKKIWWETHYGGRGGPTVLALSAFDIALWDLKAKKAGMPLWKLLGGYDPEVPCYAGGIDLHLTADELIEQTDQNIKRGFRAVKMKVGRDNLSEDVVKLEKMREHLGDQFPIMLDANMKYSADQAIKAARQFSEFDPVWLEEPVEPEDIFGHARVIQEGGVPVATGENLRTLQDFANYIHANAVTFPEPDVTNCGGVTVFMKIAKLAEAAGLPVTSHGAHDITVHLLAACPNRSWLEAHGFGLDKYIDNPLKIKNGFAIAPQKPGIGWEFDWKNMETLKC